MSLPFSVELVPERETLVVCAEGELDIATTPGLEAALDEARSAGFDQVVLDLRGVRFIDSTGAAAVLTAATDRTGREAVAVEPGDGQPRDVLDVAGILERLPVRRTRGPR